MHTVPSGARRPLAKRLWPCSLDGASVQLSAHDVSKCGRSVGAKLIRARLPGNSHSSVVINQSSPETGEMVIPQSILTAVTPHKS